MAKILNALISHDNMNPTTKQELEYYKAQGIRTKVKKGIFDDFPDELDDIVRIIQGLLIHPCTLKRLYNLDLPQHRIKDKNLKTVQEIVNKARKLDKNSLTIPREPEKRVVAICKHFSMLLCSILREKGIPARTRCGFATYFINGWFEDHWICEYWNKKQNRWIKVDAQIDDIQAVKYNIDRNRIDFLNLPKGVFFPAGVLWKLFRDGFIGSRVEGFSGDNDDGGEWYIRGNMLRDFFALNEIEFLYSEQDLLMNTERKLKKEEIVLLDRIAKHTGKPHVNFKKIRQIYQENPHLIPK